MQKLMTIMLIVAAVTLAGTVHAASAEAPSPNQQLRDGTPISEITCNDGRVLMASPSGRPACVFESSVEILLDRGFISVVKPIHADRTDWLDIQVVTNPAEVPAPFGLSTHHNVFWSDYDIELEYVVIRHEGDLYREIELDYELASGRMNVYLGITIDRVLFLFDGVKTRHVFNTIIPYALLPPITPKSADDTFVFGYPSDIWNPVVHNQTSTAQTFSFELSPESAYYVMIGRLHLLSEGNLDYLIATDQFYRHWQHEGNCEGNLIPVPRQEGADVCILPVMLEFILSDYGGQVDESVYWYIIREYEELMCPPELPVFLVDYYYEDVVCAGMDDVMELLEGRGWHGDYALTGSQYHLAG